MGVCNMSNIIEIDDWIVSTEKCKRECKENWENLFEVWTIKLTLLCSVLIKFFIFFFLYIFCTTAGIWKNKMMFSMYLPLKKMSFKGTRHPNALTSYYNLSTKKEKKEKIVTSLLDTKGETIVSYNLISIEFNERHPTCPS